MDSVARKVTVLTGVLGDVVGDAADATFDVDAEEPDTARADLVSRDAVRRSITIRAAPE